MKIKTLIPTKLISVEVPKDIKQFILINYPVSGLYLMEKHGAGLNSWKTFIDKFNRGKNYRIVGEVTKDSISFDVCNFIEWSYFDIEGFEGNKRTVDCFWDYTKETFDIFDANESFISLLESNEIFLSDIKGKILILEEI